jgi:Leucine-rich repeat (LRR) protein
LFRIGNCTNFPIVTQSLLTSFINNITLSNRTIASNGPTPEDRALNYLIYKDTTFNKSQLLTLNSTMTNMVQFRIRQRYALLTLWFQQAFYEKKWYSISGWLVNANECDNWYGIDCTSISLGGAVGIQDVVTAVDLNFNDVKGTIPADLGLLTSLTRFDVNFNVLTGTLPASIGQWTALTSFNVYYNALNGTLPASIGQLTALTYFNVNNNALSGTIPASIGNWSQIQYAYFDANQFTGIMPNGICPYINETYGDVLQADCYSEINCTCCTYCYE